MNEELSLVDAITITGKALSIADVASIARFRRRVELSQSAMEAVTRNRVLLESVMSDGKPHYGVNTGFGSFSRQRIAEGDLRDLQHNLIRSHAAGVGEPLEREVVRAMILLLVASLSRGRSGVRVEVIERLIAVLNHPAGLLPRVPSVGSCGASGDLAPLSHVILGLMGEGEWNRYPSAGSVEVVSGKVALREMGLQPMALAAKEGLALINGTHLMAAQGALLIDDAERFFSAAVMAAAMSLDACRGTDSFLDERVYVARNQPGPAIVAQRLRSMLRGSQIVVSHVKNDPRVQDPYSLRCCPHVLGAAWDAIRYVKLAVEQELGAVTDNPMIFESSDGRGVVGEIVSAGNFHGMPIALPLDTLGIALAHVAGIAERRISHIMAAGAGEDLEAKLPAFLSPKSGLHSGLMIAHYTAAACCNEIVGLTMPASVSNFTTSAGMEDYNSWGPRSAAKARRILDLATNVIAIEFLCAAQGIEHHRPLKSGELIEQAHAKIRAVVPKLVADRPPTPDIAAIESLIRSGELSLV